MPYIYPPHPPTTTTSHISTPITTMSQTMLLTKRLSAFLSQSTSPHLHTLILLSPNGKLLSSSSHFPASTLRTQATLAVSLWSLYHPYPSNDPALISSSLSLASTVPNKSGEREDLNAITIQLEHGIMHIRALHSTLLFVAIGPSTPVPSSQNSSSQYLQARIASSTNTSGPSSPGAIEEGFVGGAQVLGQALGESRAGSEAGSIGSERGVGASIWGVRRRAEEVSAALEERLVGFELSGEGR